jgi:hypothetical protein
MTKEFEIKVPSVKENIQLHKYQKYIKLLQDNEDIDADFHRLKVLQIFCGLELNEANKLPVAELDFIVNHIVKIVSTEDKLQRKFTMTDPSGKTVEFGFMPNLSEMTLGEYVDLESYISDWEQMHKALAVMYRPIVAGRGDFYEIEEYEGSAKYAEIMKDAPMNVATGAMVFFYSLGKELLKTTLRSLQEDLQKDPQQQNLPSETNGDGINQYMHSLEEMFSNLETLQKQI